MLEIRVKVKFRAFGMTFGQIDRTIVVPVIPGKHQVLNERGVEVWVEKKSN